MKIALCTTTIHVPHALKLMRKCSEDIHFFVAGDEKTPVANTLGKECVVQQVLGLSDKNYSYFSPDASDNWRCSYPIGWNTLARRNIAFLEALKWGADVIYSWDNDNLPVNESHVENIAKLFGPTRLTQATRLVEGMMVPSGTHWNFNGLKIEAPEWFDPGYLLIPRTRHRGIPSRKLDAPKIGHVVDAKIGIAAGLIIGNPDVDASTRIELKPDIAQTHLLGQTGVVVDPHTWTVFNTQNTAVIRELIPAWFMMPGVGRHDDIYASLIVQRVARERNLHVHFGPPFCYQQRNEHNLITDLRAEIDGMENVERLATFLDSIILPAKSVIADTRIIYHALRTTTLVPEQACVAALAYLDDCEGLGL